jgi:uncharacterized low-complexity protein
MKKIFIITTVSAAALLGACGSTASTSKTSTPVKKVTKTHSKSASAKTASLKPGFHTQYSSGALFLTLPYVGKASPTIMYYAQQNSSFYHEIINPADWVKSKTFGQYIFVGPYTTGVSYQRIRDAKIAAVNTMETFILEANYQQTWPTVLNGFNYDAFGQRTFSQPALTSFYKSSVALGHGTMTAVVPSEATIVESPVGSLTAAQMANGPGQPQTPTLGICVPHESEIKNSGGGYAAKVGQVLGASTTQQYFADYGNTNVIFSNSVSLGVGSNPTNSCANFS